MPHRIPGYDPGPPTCGTLQIITDQSSDTQPLFDDDPGPQAPASIQKSTIHESDMRSMIYDCDPGLPTHKQLRTEAQKLHIGDLVLVHKTKDTCTRPCARKLDNRWFGLYRIREIPEDSTFYYLEELDGTPLTATFAGIRLKRFFTRNELDNHRSETHGAIRARENLERDSDVEKDALLEDV